MKFVSDVAKGRKVPIHAALRGGEGRMVGAKEAVAQGMATSVGSLEDPARVRALSRQAGSNVPALGAARSSRAAIEAE